eukprot:5582455-Prymnesium_polylepis.1
MKRRSKAAIKQSINQSIHTCTKRRSKAAGCPKRSVSARSLSRSMVTRARSESAALGSSQPAPRGAEGNV